MSSVKNTVIVNGETSVVTVQTQGPQGPSFADGNLGDVTVSNNGTSIFINSGAIDNANINGSAAIEGSKLQASSGSNSGTMSAANFTKLDGIETGATADQTASEILTLIKTVDGTGSGLDADTLDGISSVSFVRSDAADTCSGKITFSDGIVLPTTSKGIKFGAGDAINDDAHIEWLGGNNVGYLRISTSDDSGSASPEYIEFGDYAQVDKGGTFTRWYKLSRSGHEFTGDISVSGTVDGVDIAARNTLFGGLTSSSGVLTNGVTATTQSASDNSTKVATTAYTDTAIANLVNSAPSTLDTLGEIATALNNDAALNTTLTNSIATKMPLAGGQFTGNITFSGSQTVDGRDLSVDGTKLDGIESNATADQTASEIVALVADQTIAPSIIDMEDNEQIKLGTGDDLQIYHDGTNSAIQNGTGQLYLYGGTEHILIRPKNDENGIVAKPNNNVELFFDNSRKLYTQTYGVTVTGTLSASEGLSTEGGYLNLQGTTARKILLQGVDGNQIRYRRGDSTFVANLTSVGNGDTFRIENELHSQTLDIVSGGVNVSGTLKIGSNTTISESNSNNTAIIQHGDIHHAIIFRGDTNADGSTITQSNTTTFREYGNFVFRTGAGNLYERLKIFQGGESKFVNNDENIARFIPNAAVELYYDNSKKFESISTGASVTGSLGINTTSPISDVHISKSFHSPTGGIDSAVALTLSNTTAGNAVGICLLASEQNVSFIHFGDPSDANIGAIGYNHPSEFMSFTVNAQERMQIDSSGNLNINKDNAILQIGQHQDLQLSHNVSSSIIRNNTGELVISCGGSANANPVKIQPNQGESSITAHQNAQVELFYDNSKKLETTSNGITVSGSNATGSRINGSLVLATDGGTTNLELFGSNGVLRFHDSRKASFGTSDDLQIYHDGSNSYIQDLGTGQLRFLSNDYVFYNASGNENIARFIENDSVELYYDGSKKFETISNGAVVTGNLGLNTSSPKTLSGQTHLTINQAATGTQVAGIALRIGDADSGNIISYPSNGEGLRLTTFNADKDITFKKNISGTDTELVRITSAGHINIPNDSGKLQLGASQDLEIFHDGTDSFIKNTTGHLKIGDANVRIMNAACDEDMIHAKQNEQVELYYDNSKKFETTSTGASVTGALTVGVASALNNNVAHLRLADSSIATPSNQSVLLVENNTNTWITIGSGASSYGGILFGDSGAAGRGQVRFNHNGDIMQMIANEEKLFQATLNGAAELYYDNSQKLATFSGGISVTGQVNSDGSHMGDSDKAIFGNSNDLEIDHDGSHSNIHNVGTGNLHIRGNGTDQIKIQAKSGEQSIVCNSDAAVELYYDNSKKLETLSGGVNVTGSLTATGDLTLTHTHPKLFLVDTDNNSDYQVSNTNGVFTIKDTTNSVDRITIQPNGQFSFNAGTDTMGIGIYNTGSPVLGHVFIYGDNGLIRFRNNSNTYTANIGYNESSNNLFLNNLEAGTQLSVIADGAKLGDNKKFIAGNDSDLQIYHDGNNSKIENSTGILKIVSGDKIDLCDGNSSTFYARLNSGNSVELYYDNSKKLETTSYGVAFVAEAKFDNNTNANRDVVWDPANDQLRWTDNTKATFGTTSDLEIIHNGTDSRIINNLSDLFIYTVGDHDVKILADSQNAVICKPDAAVELYYDNVKKLETTTNGITVTGSVTTQDMNMSNLNGSANEVDNTKGSWSIQEGSNDLFIINRVTGKKYKFNLTEIS
jgi:hypothetical protein